MIAHGEKRLCLPKMFFQSTLPRGRYALFDEKLRTWNLLVLSTSTFLSIEGDFLIANSFANGAIHFGSGAMRIVIRLGFASLGARTQQCQNLGMGQLIDDMRYCEGEISIRCDDHLETHRFVGHRVFSI
jgi:hypothetical protein